MLSGQTPATPDIAGGAWKSGDRVFYVENGVRDSGTVTALRPVGKGRKSVIEYHVDWDNGDESDWYTASQLRTYP
jgi:hypothetical protein